MASIASPRCWQRGYRSIELEREYGATVLDDRRLGDHLSALYPARLFYGRAVYDAVHKVEPLSWGGGWRHYRLQDVARHLPKVPRCQGCGLRFTLWTDEQREADYERRVYGELVSMRRPYRRWLCEHFVCSEKCLARCRRRARGAWWREQNEKQNLKEARERLRTVRKLLRDRNGTRRAAL